MREGWDCQWDELASLPTPWHCREAGRGAGELSRASTTLPMLWFHCQRNSQEKSVSDFSIPGMEAEFLLQAGCSTMIPMSWELGELQQPHSLTALTPRALGCARCHSQSWAGAAQPPRALQLLSQGAGGSSPDTLEEAPSRV